MKLDKETLNHLYAGSRFVGNKFRMLVTCYFIEDDSIDTALDQSFKAFTEKSIAKYKNIISIHTQGFKIDGASLDELDPFIKEQVIANLTNMGERLQETNKKQDEIAKKIRQENERKKRLKK